MTVGWSFSIGSQDVQVTALGIYDDLADGLADAHAVGIWTNGGTLLAEVTVPSGTTATLVGSYRYTPITPVTLAAGQTFVVGAYFPPCGSSCGDSFLNGGKEIFDARITFLQSQNSAPQSGTGSLAFPSGNLGIPPQGMFGPNLLFVAPAPCDSTQQSFTTNSAAGTTSGVIQPFVVPADVSSIRINAAGAQGGYGGARGGGLGAEVAATVAVTPGQTLCVGVGVQGAGGLNAGGGGGGSFVYGITAGTCASNLPTVTAGAASPNLLIASAGGGGGGFTSSGVNGIVPNGADVVGASAGANGNGGGGIGGTGGNGGGAISFGGGGGGGLLNDGATVSGAQGGFALVDGAAGGIGVSGGFGGGGAAGGGNGGGGGGYNGGGGGGDIDTGGGGGGSYSITVPLAPYTRSVQQGNGVVSLCYYSDLIFANGFE